MSDLFLNCIDNRKGERLVQGVLLFLLKTQHDFRQAFCDWLEWPLFSHLKEEFSECDHRHDLVFFYGNDVRKTIELKFRAGWTDSQRVDPDAIDLVIVPKSRLDEAKEIFKDSRSWEDFDLYVVNSSTLAKVLLSGLNAYYRTPETLQNNDELNELLNVAFRRLEHGTCFLKQFQTKIELPNLCVGPIGSSLKGWKGFYIRNLSLGAEWKKSLWFGIITNVEKWKKYRHPEFHLILQICSCEQAAKLPMSAHLPPYFDYEGYNQGIIIEPDPDDHFSLSETWSQCENVVKQYSRLGLEE